MAGNNGEVLRGIQRSLFVALFTPIGEGARNSGFYGLDTE